MVFGAWPLLWMYATELSRPSSFECPRRAGVKSLVKCSAVGGGNRRGAIARPVCLLGDFPADGPGYAGSRPGRQRVARGKGGSGGEGAEALRTGDPISRRPFDFFIPLSSPRRRPDEATFPDPVSPPRPCSP
jgi:hypothetical protein